MASFVPGFDWKEFEAVADELKVTTSCADCNHSSTCCSSCSSSSSHDNKNLVGRETADNPGRGLHHHHPHDEHRYCNHVGVLLKLAKAAAVAFQHSFEHQCIAVCVVEH